MKLKLLTAVAALVASAAASAGELDGKGYICKVGSGVQTMIWSPWFQDGQVFVSAIMPPVRGEEPELQVQTVGSEYSAVGDLVSWGTPTGITYYFDPKTLQIGQENRSPHSESYGDIEFFIPCKEATSLDSFTASMEKELARTKVLNTCSKEPTDKLAITCLLEAEGEIAKEG